MRLCDATSSKAGWVSPMLICHPKLGILIASGNLHVPKYTSRNDMARTLRTRFGHTRCRYRVDLRAALDGGMTGTVYTVLIPKIPKI